MGEIDTGIECVTTWQPLIDALPDTNLCFAYATEPKKGCLTPKQKEAFKNTEDIETLSRIQGRANALVLIARQVAAAA